MSLLSGMVAMGRLDSFIHTMYREAGEDRLWERYLSEPFKDHGYGEWKEMVSNPPEKKDPRMTREDVETTIRKSEDILSNFVPG